MHTLTYTDCSELREAGFPQREKTGAKYITPNNLFAYYPDNFENEAYCPTLSELIVELSLDGFTRFHLIWKNRANVWQAAVYHNKRNHTYVNGPSPILAVKNLYLAINKK